MKRNGTNLRRALDMGLETELDETDQEHLKAVLGE